MGCSGCESSPQKEVENFYKHGIWFEDACCVFEDPNRQLDPDDRDYDEDRWIAIGRGDSAVLVVVFTERNGREWIISARKAEPREEKGYYARSRR